MTYEEIIPLLQNNHFYPGREITGDKINGLRIECPATFLMDGKKERLEEILKGENVKVDKFSNHGYLLITKKK